MILGVNDNPSIRPYAYLAYIDAILENNLLVRMQIKDAASRKWKSISYDTDIIWEEDYLNIYSRDAKWGQNNTETCIFTECSEKQEIIIKLEQFVNIRENAIVNCFACEGCDSEYFLSNPENGYRLGITRYGLYIKHNEQVVSIDANELYDYVGEWNSVKWVKICLNDDMLIAFISKDGRDWMEIDHMQLQADQQFNIIGINTNFLGLGAEYYNWLYMNFIQMNLNKNEMSRIYLNYYQIPYVGAVNEQNIAPQFLESRKDVYEEIVDVFYDFKEYLNYYLEHNYYTSIAFDEFYVPGHRRFGKQHFYHPVLVYGYEEKTNEFLILDYNRKLIKSRVDADLFICKENVKKNYSIMRYRLVSNTAYEKMDFNLSVVTKMIHNYLESYNLKDDYSFYLPAVKGTYGISIWDDLIHDNYLKKRILWDVRFSYILYEHNLIMERRIEFLGNNGYLKGDRLSKIADYCCNIAEQLEVLKNSVFKYFCMKNQNMSQSRLDKLGSQILGMFEKIKTLEQQMYRELLVELEGR